MFLSLAPSRVQSPLSCHAYRNTGPRPIHRAQHPQSQVRAACMRCVMEAHYCSRVGCACTSPRGQQPRKFRLRCSQLLGHTHDLMHEPSRPIPSLASLPGLCGTDVGPESILVSEKRNSPGLAPIDRCHCYSAPPSNTPCHPTPEALAFLHSGAAAFKKPSAAAAARGVQ